MSRSVPSSPFEWYKIWEKMKEKRIFWNWPLIRPIHLQTVLKTCKKRLLLGLRGIKKEFISLQKAECHGLQGLKTSNILLILFSLNWFQQTIAFQYRTQSIILLFKSMIVFYRKRYTELELGCFSITTVFLVIAQRKTLKKWWCFCNIIWSDIRKHIRNFVMIFISNLSSQQKKKSSNLWALSWQ